MTAVKIDASLFALHVVLLVKATQFLWVKSADRFAEVTISWKIGQVEHFGLEVTDDPWKHGVLVGVAEGTARIFIKERKVSEIVNLSVDPLGRILPFFKLYRRILHDF